MPIQNQRVIADFEAQAFRYRVLAFFDTAVHELFDLAAVNTHDVIVVPTLIELEHRHAAFEMMASDETGGLELGQYAIHRGEADVFVGYQQLLVDVFRAHVARRSIGQNVEDFQSWQRHFEACIAQVVAFAGRGGFQALRHAVPSGMIQVRLSIISWLRTTLTKIFQRVLLGMALGALASGCVYRINIQQGNFLDQSAVEQVKAGMTRSQVRYLLGTPMVADPFVKDRWDYIYYLKKGRNRHVDSRRVTVYFDGEKVARLDKPTAAEAAAQDASAAQIKNGRTY
jgi:outer membrane protein assembly factor BamE